MARLAVHHFFQHKVLQIQYIRSLALIGINTRAKAKREAMKIYCDKKNTVSLHVVIIILNRCNALVRFSASFLILFTAFYTHFTLYIHTYFLRCNISHSQEAYERMTMKMMICTQPTVYIFMLHCFIILANEYF